MLRNSLRVTSWVWNRVRQFSPASISTCVTGRTSQFMRRNRATDSRSSAWRCSRDPRCRLHGRRAGGEEIEETFLAIRELPGRKLVTVIEVLSPTNKKTEDARAEYLKKRETLIRSRVNLVEIDLLRGGEPMPLEHSPPPIRLPHPGLSWRTEQDAVLFTFPYTSPIPPISIPLLPGDPEPELDLNSVLHALIERARYDLVIDYTQPPDPPLRPADEAWAATIVAGALDARREETRSEENHAMNCQDRLYTQRRSPSRQPPLVS